jgi:hypothetical protein
MGSSVANPELLVRVTASLDQHTGILAWSFTSIDPATGMPPTDPQVGFLPPNATPPEGEVAIVFSVQPRAELADGTILANWAGVVFDNGTPVDSPAWANTLDGTPPESQDSSSFTVRGGGTTPDLRDYTVYVSEDGGTYRALRSNTTATADTFVALPGSRSYAFYSLARDSCGNVESPPLVPDAVTLSRVSVDGPAGRALALEVAPNPTSGQMQIRYTLPGSASGVLSVADIAGRLLFRRIVGRSASGAQSIALDGVLVRPGVYLVRLAHGSQVVHERIVVR